MKYFTGKIAFKEHQELLCYWEQEVEPQKLNIVYEFQVNRPYDIYILYAKDSDTLKGGLLLL